MALEPCRECGAKGAENLVIDYEFIKGYEDARRVKCLRCGHRGLVMEGKEAAMEYWNRNAIAVRELSPGQPTNSTIAPLTLSRCS